MATRILTTLAVLAAISSPAFAAKHHAEPPARFRTFSGELITHTVPQGGATSLCRELSRTYYGSAVAYFPGTLGCSIGGILDGDTTCVIVVTSGKPHVTRHEIAHCAGWPADHRR